MISTDRAIPIALMVTEAITNSLKHAFPDGRAGTIRVAFEPDGPQTGVLVVEDDGVGFPEGAPAAGGLGLQLIEAFARQIGGDVRFSDPPGAAIRVTVDDRERSSGADAALEEPAASGPDGERPVDAPGDAPVDEGA
jgi:two-component sensor histidine kinase